MKCFQGSDSRQDVAKIFCLQEEIYIGGGLSGSWSVSLSKVSLAVAKERSRKLQSDLTQKEFSKGYFLPSPAQLSFSLALSTYPGNMQNVLIWLLGQMISSLSFSILTLLTIFIKVDCRQRSQDTRHRSETLKVALAMTHNKLALKKEQGSSRQTFKVILKLTF